jgi:glycosyltransferase involved in cell wall biosynthesis
MREKMDADGSRYWLGVFGAITPRKNLHLIIESIIEQTDIGLLMAGSIDPQVSKTIAPLLAQFTSNGGKVYQISGPLTDAEFDSAIAAVDCVVAAHSNEGPSSVVLKAVAAGRRLVLAGAKSLQKDAAHLRGQATWSDLDVKALRRAIRQAQTLPPPPTVEHSAEEFVKSLTQA